GKINFIELMYGYPVGNCRHNPVKITTTFHEAIRWQDQQKNTGDTDSVTLTYEYNENDYPVRFIAIGDTITLQYKCE
ncbi:MAG: hypothetical protein KJ607_11655, partial [Bacteroidetes bacterium]|nr:hypothetical protein [Bacteroidota bacterium]